MQKNILVVEDEIIIANVLEKYINDFGYNCAGIAVDAEEAIFLIENRKIDLVLLDIKISGKKTGIDIAKIINDKYNIPFIFLTAHTDLKTMNPAKTTMPAGYLPKPVNKQTLRTSIEIVLYSHEYSNKKLISVQSGKSKYLIDVNSIHYVKSDHVYLILQLDNSKLVIRSTFSDFLESVEPGVLIQVNRSLFVNVKKVSSYTKNEVTVYDETFKIGEKCKPSFFKTINF